LQYEAAVMNSLDGLPGFPNFYGYKKEGHEHAIVMELLGESFFSFVIRKGK
jgi:hypothetical protein